MSWLCLTMFIFLANLVILSCYSLQYWQSTIFYFIFVLYYITLYCSLLYIFINFVLDSVYLLWWWITKYCFVLFSKILYYTSLYYSMLLCYYVFSVIMFLIYWVLLVQINVSLNYFVFCQVVMCYVVIFSLITLY